MIYDEEFAELVDAGAVSRKRFIAWTDPPHTHSEPLLEELCSSGHDAELEPPLEKGRVVILTSGTTGTPKGAARKQPDSIDPAASLFSKIPLRARETTVIAAPMFHSWGFGHFTLSLPLASTLVLHRRFDPEDTLRAVAQHHASVLVLVPVMLQRILDLGEETIARYDTSCLRVIALSGSALPGELATRAMDTFGDVLYNLYGSTEVAWATIATPEDLRAAPGTAGRAPMGTVVKLLDENGLEAEAGEPGRIFVGNEMVFDGYTGGGGKQIIGGLMSTGDMGRFDSAGRLFVEGRDDEMIVSGGENVFPREVEDLLAEHPKIEEVAVIGVPDPRTPHIGEEVAAVAAHLPKAQILMGPDATVDRLRKAAAESRFVHIATHGEFRTDNPMFSSIRLADSFLSVYDLYDFRLKAELVTLSGCGTGLSVVTSGDELLGLVRGLLYSGARAVLLTLWDVNDESTAEFMKCFYTKMAATDDKSDALRQAVQELRQSYPDVYHWAPFVLIGNA